MKRLRPLFAEMAYEHYPRAALGEVADGRQSAAQTIIVYDPLILNRHIQRRAHQYRDILEYLYVANGTHATRVAVRAG